MADYAIHGGLGSPYSLKMRAVLRYRRLPHRWVNVGLPQALAELYKHVRAPVIPVIVFPDGTVMNDSTPLIRELERRHAERSIVPEDPAHNFLSYLLEDMADEWGTKAMFHYRWFRPRDQDQLSQWLAFDRLKGQGRSAIQAAADAFKDRQVGRMALVGCTPQNAPVIEASAARIYAILDDMAADELYLFGARPSMADFGWYGQLSQLASDPTSSDLMRETAPLLMRWLLGIDDASGVEGAWGAPGAAATALLRHAGETYMPFLLANAAAADAGHETFETELMGMPYAQGVFRYQVKCLAELRAAYAALDAGARKAVDPMLEDAGLLAGLKA